ncbi:hypothetical protein TNCT_636831 [Trichonephila clavata]|uniref:Uncharacterized protein n=1 Tax=Trichonephila clavata TaxID=2740835 RepID=A0A8X6HA88_TRICU|nr:hypothetical protein TNCT_636831 [Trichonephila clavata]
MDTAQQWAKMPQNKKQNTGGIGRWGGRWKGVVCSPIRRKSEKRTFSYFPAKNTFRTKLGWEEEEMLACTRRRVLDSWTWSCPHDIVDYPRS